VSIFFRPSDVLSSTAPHGAMASRIRITNLPKQITVRKLKEHFGAESVVVYCAVAHVRNNR
jgi:hypothetical protein